MNSRIGFGLCLISLGLLVVARGIVRGGEEQLLFAAAGLLVEAGGLFLICSGPPQKKQ